MGKSVKNTRWQACNVMDLEGDSPRLWQVNTAGGKMVLARDKPLLATEAILPRHIAKDWNDLVRPRLNVAVLPSDSVFVRVVELPKSTPEETFSMLEFQLEKLSPLPVAQVVWTYEIVPNRGLSETQSILMVIASRSVVEDLLGKLETKGYLADRIEFPFMDQLVNLEVTHDGVWLFPEMRSGGEACWVGWWYGGALHNVALVNLPSGQKRVEVLQEQLTQMQWAGELEGWITAPPRYTLVCDEPLASEWLPELQRSLNTTVQVTAPIQDKQLVALTAKRATRLHTPAQLLPQDYATKYRQLFVDRIWMQSLFGLLGIYLLGVLVYMGIVAFKKYQLDSTQDLERTMGVAYTNAVQLREQVQVLQERVNLQYAALNCYLAVATNLPPELTLDSMNFDRGTRLTLGGTGGSDTRQRVNEFMASLKQAQFKNQPLFKTLEGLKTFNKPGGQQVSWSFSCELKKIEIE